MSGCGCGPTTNGIPDGGGGAAAVAQLDWKESVRAATTAPGVLATDFEAGGTIDTVLLAAGDRILIKDQAAGAENGIYVVQASGAPVRAPDADTDAEVTSGMATYVSEGAANGQMVFVLVTPDPITLGVTALVFSPLASLSVCGLLPTTSDAGPALVGAATDAARCDHKHTISVAAPVSVDKSANAPGTAVSLSRSDHKHDVDTAAPAATGVSTASGEGVATTLARSDHTHQSNTAPANVTKAAAVIGVSGEPARADHKHDVDTAVPVTIGTANAEGTATELARSDHVHDHGNLAGGSLHALATTIVAGFMSAADKSKLDGITAGSTPAVIQLGAGSIATTTTTRYLFPCYSDQQAEVAPANAFRVPFAGTLSKLRVRTATPGTGVSTLTYTVRVNGVASTLVVSMANTANDGTDLVNSIAVAAGDLVDIEIGKSAALTTSPLDVFASMELAA